MDYLVRQNPLFWASLKLSFYPNHQPTSTTSDDLLVMHNEVKDLTFHTPYPILITKPSPPQEHNNIQEKLKELESKAYNGDLDAVQELIKMSIGIKSTLGNNIELTLYSKQILNSLSSAGPENVQELLFSSLPNDGNILEGLIYSDSKFAKEASEKLVEKLFNSNLSSLNTSKLLQESKLIKKVLNHLKKTPDKNVDFIGKIANTTGYGIEILADLAKDKPGNISGKKAARVLAVIFINQSGRKAEFALESLKNAVKNGNVHALMILTNIAKMGPQIKALQTVDALFDIAMETNSSGSKGTNTAMGSLIDISEDNKVATRVRIRAIHHLGNLILQGKDSGYDATDALIRIAENPVNNQIIRNESIETIIKISEQKPDILERSKNLLYKIANNKIPCSEKHRKSAKVLLKNAFSS